MRFHNERTYKTNGYYVSDISVWFAMCRQRKISRCGSIISSNMTCFAIHIFHDFCHNVSAVNRYVQILSLLLIHFLNALRLTFMPINAFVLFIICSNRTLKHYVQGI